MLRIELLYFDGCPSWERAWITLGQTLATSRIDATVQLRHLDDLSAEERHGFAGSPTIRLDGRDLEGYDGPPLYACRRYETNEGRGWPHPERLRKSLEAAVRRANR